MVGFTLNMNAQHNKAVIYFNSDAPSKIKYKLPHSISSKKILDTILFEYKTVHLNKGYLSFSVDSLIESAQTFNVYLHKGNKYKLASIGIVTPEFQYLSKHLYIKPILTKKTLNEIDKKTLISIQNKGYPYATISRNIEFNNRLANITYSIDKGLFFTFDSIKTSPPGLISYYYLAKKTGIEAQKPYRLSNLHQAKKNLSKTKLFTIDSIYQYLINKKAIAVIKMKPNAQNSFNGLIGLQSNDNKETEITGNLSLNLTNSLKKGESIKLNWQKPQSESQQLETSIHAPYVFNLPIGISTYAFLDKHDTTFTNSHIELGLLIPSINYGEVAVLGKWLNSSVNSSKSDLNSNKTILYGLGYTNNSFTDPFIKKQGFSIESKFFLGDSKIKNSDNNTSTLLYSEGILDLSFAFPMPLGSIYIKNLNKIILNDSLKINNIYRIGGANSIRGVNENSIYSKAFSYINSEYRVFINTTSYIFALYDAGIFNEPEKDEFNLKFRQGIGGGISLNTKSGILSISFALGKSKNNPFLLNESKLHIGYTNRF